MNERIKELAHEAGLPTYNPEGIPTKLEKFAELIVRECVNLCYDRAYQGTLGSFTDGAMLCANDIKEHFGVKE